MLVTDVFLGVLRAIWSFMILSFGFGISLGFSLQLNFYSLGVNFICGVRWSGPLRLSKYNARTENSVHRNIRLACSSVWLRRGLPARQASVRFCGQEYRWVAVALTREWDSNLRPPALAGILYRLATTRKLYVCDTSNRIFASWTGWDECHLRAQLLGSSCLPHPIQPTRHTWNQHPDQETWQYQPLRAQSLLRSCIQQESFYSWLLSE